ncbi:hypothetical protein [Micromonospora humida]|uniref:Uncharacterized protein n=1 Tax=Micromonospora humida TaxID=2809018 RepID=A0ABS2IVF5_9ACTN|nr:hypothetical protein [Micromonospora humida]MBM7077236.1 hypothetical protein [Micromonospora humida]
MPATRAMVPRWRVPTGWQGRGDPSWDRNDGRRFVVGSVSSVHLRRTLIGLTERLPAVPAAARLREDIRLR